MPQVTIDNQSITVEAGTTILQAARRLGIPIPTLCFWQECTPQTSCMVCVVKLAITGKLVPACAYVVHEGLRVESQTGEVMAVRRRNLELLLSEHLGDCAAPCQGGCPAGMDIPLMIRQIAAGQMADAVRTVKRDIPLPSILGRICPAPCEAVCRRKAQDQPVAICQLKRHVGDWELLQPTFWLGEQPQSSGKKVAIIGAGPAGLSAAWFLRTLGHAVVILEEGNLPGGKLRQIYATILPADVISREADIIRQAGGDIQFGVKVGRNVTLDELTHQYDAVLLATGEMDINTLSGWDLATNDKGLVVDKTTLQTSRDGVFAAGNIIQKGKLAIRSIAQANRAAAAIDQYLSGKAVSGPDNVFSCHIGKLKEGEINAFMADASTRGRVVEMAQKLTPLTPSQAVEEANRCLHCDCRKAGDCRLRQVCQEYAMPAPRLGDNRPVFQQQSQTRPSSGQGRVIYEPGKCIRCGLCVQITERVGEKYGLAFVGRGFEAFITAPFGRTLDEALTVAAGECVAACPAAALAFAVQSEHQP